MLARWLQLFLSLFPFPVQVDTPREAGARAKNVKKVQYAGKEKQLVKLVPKLVLKISKNCTKIGTKLSGNNYRW